MWTRPHPIETLIVRQDGKESTLTKNSYLAMENQKFFLAKRKKIASKKESGRRTP
jgi:hypothetical protein